MIYTVTLNPALDRELSVPAITHDTVLRATESRVDCGGKGFNVSRMLAALGVESVALGFAGGHTGEILREGLAALGIATDFTPVSGETRSNVSIVAPEHHIKVNEAGPTISPDAQAALVNKVRALARSDDWWILAGSLPPGIPATFYADLIHDIRSAGGHVILDTSGEALPYGCEAQPTVVKPNALEMSQLTGLPVHSIPEALHAARVLGHIRYVVISLGDAGALLVHDGHGWLASPPTIQERNPIGAGDSLVAGLVWGLHHGDPLFALRWGVACGAATASHNGTAVGTYSEVEHLAQQVQITEVFV